MARYSALTTNTTTGPDDLVPDLIIPEVTASAAREEVFMPLVKRYDRTGPGEVFTIPTAGTLAFAALGSQSYIDGTSPDEVAFSTGARTFTPTFEFLDVVVGFDLISGRGGGAGSGLSVTDEIVKEAAIGLASRRDTRFGALNTEANASAPDHIRGTDGTALAFSDIRLGFQLMVVAKAPRPYDWVVDPVQLTELLSDNTFVDASVKGGAVLTEGIKQGGLFTNVLGMNILVSDNLVQTSGPFSMLFSHQNAIGYVFKRIGKDPGNLQELMMDIDWNAAKRMFEINMTYQAAVGGLKGTSTTTNTWLATFAS